MTSFVLMTSKGLPVGVVLTLEAADAHEGPYEPVPLDTGDLEFEASVLRSKNDAAESAVTNLKRYVGELEQQLGELRRALAKAKRHNLLLMEDY